jgi:peptide/nickel transport system substrate-binding protein
MIDALLKAKTGDEFVSSVRALDRVLLSGFYVIPLFYVGEQWLAYDSALQRPSRMPLFGSYVDVWWREPDTFE